MQSILVRGRGKPHIGSTVWTPIDRELVAQVPGTENGEQAELSGCRSVW